MAPQTISVNENKGMKQYAPMLIILMLGLFMVILNQTLLSVAMPRMMAEFNVAATTIQWLSTGFMLVNGALIPLSAFLIERFGTRVLFLSAMFLFTVGTLICGIAPNFPVILTGRLIQADWWRDITAISHDDHPFYLPSRNAWERNGNLWARYHVCPCHRSNFIWLGHTGI